MEQDEEWKETKTWEKPTFRKVLNFLSIVTLNTQRGVIELGTLPSSRDDWLAIQ